MNNKASVWVPRLIGVAASATLFAGLAVSPATPASAAANPNPARITEASWWLMQQLQSLEPGTQNGGIYANKPGYHNTRDGNDPDNYSVRDAEDRGGPSDKAAAYDWTFPEAQSVAADLTNLAASDYAGPVNPTDFRAASADYSGIAKYSKRLLASGRDSSDPRLDGWKEFFGQADNDSGVEGYDFRADRTSTSDESHLWHIHLSEDRDKVESFENKLALLSVLRGETVAQWKGHAAVDFNGDRRSDLALYRPDAATGSTWWVRTVGGDDIYGAHKYGGAEDIPVTGDFNGDGISDMALYRQDCASGSTWWVKNGATGVQMLGDLKFGGCKDIPTIGDFNGDGADDLGLYRQDCTNGSSWQLYNVRAGGAIASGVKFGGCKDLPTSGDYDGDGADDFGLYRQDCTDGSTWWAKSVKTGDQLVGALKFGGCKDLPTSGDYTGDGADDLGLYRRDCTSGSTWHLYNAKAGKAIASGVKFGGCNDIPTSADYNGDGADDLGLYRQDCTNGSSWQLYDARADKAIVSGLKYGGCKDIPVTRTTVS